MASLIRPCCPTNISLRKLIIPIQMIGPTSTPPIGGITFLVKFKTELVGIAIKTKNPLFKSTFGYQVNINLIRKAKVSSDKRIPSARSITFK